MRLLSAALAAAALAQRRRPPGASASPVTSLAARRLQQSSPSPAWPHHLTLILMFDEHPEEMSWKFENRRTTRVLAGVAFGTYGEDLAGETLEVALDILTADDYEGDWMGVASGALRDYRFVMYDRVSLLV